MNDNFIPTCQLKFVERKYINGANRTITFVNVLQQKWIKHSTHHDILDEEQWRDVPLEETTPRGERVNND